MKLKFYTHLQTSLKRSWDNTHDLMLRLNVLSVSFGQSIFAFLKGRHKVSVLSMLFMLLLSVGTFAQTLPTDDFDGDGVINSLDIDDDNDGIPDYLEQNCPIVGTFTNWSSVTANTSATGTLGLTSGNVTVTYTSPTVASVQNPNWYGFGDAYKGVLPSAGANGLQSLNGVGSTHTYSFSQALTNPILIFWSDNGNTYTFNKPFKVLGTPTTSHTIVSATSFSASGEGAIAVQFIGTYSTLSYTSSIVENWTGVTVGVQQCTDMDTDGDLTLNKFDLDSDDDTCSDAFESGATATKTANFTFAASGVGTNGLANSLEAASENGSLNYNLTYNYAVSASQNMCIDSDSDGIADVVDMDDDNDGISDAVENQCPTLAKWTNWTAVTSNVSATGTLPLSTGNVTVTYTSPQVYSIQQPGYFNINDVYAGTMPASGTEGLQALHGAGTTHTYTFSQPVVNPILVFWSMNGNTFTFTKNFNVVGKTPNITVGSHAIACNGAEGNATIQFIGTYASISYTSAILENWTGVTVGSNYCPDVNSDADALVNRFDLDSDEDGCSDAFEGGATADKTANYAFSGAVGTNGLDNSLETVADNGTVNYTSTYANFALDNTKNKCTLPSPGGVITSLSRWYKADNNASSASWEDASPYSKNTTKVTGSITLNSTGANFNPYVNFNNGYFYAPPAYQGINTDNTKIFTVNIPKAGSNNTSWGQQSVSGYNIGAFNPWSDGQVYFDAPWSYRTNTNFATAGGVYGVPTLMRDSKFGGSNYIHLAGKQIATAGAGAYTGNYSGSTNVFHIGAQYGYPSNNDLAELVIYENAAALTATQVQQIESYLAIKYGITLNQTTAYSYLHSGGTTIWNAIANVGYKNNIIGIGRDNAAGLNQKQSKSVNAGTQPTIGNGTGIAATNAANVNTFSADKSYDIIGDNGLASTFGVAYVPTSFTPVSPFLLMNRIWKVQETGTVGTVTISIPLSIGAERLLVSGTSGFVPASTQEILLVNDGNGNRAASVDLTDGQFFTFGRMAIAPGCVAANLKLWLKADAGTTLTTGKVSNWASQAVGMSVSQANAAKQPNWVENGMNFNPALDYTGAQVLTNLNQASSVFSSTTDPATLYGVSTNRNATAWWKVLINFDGNDDFPSPNLNWFGQQADGYSFGLTTPDSRHTTVIPLNTPTMMFSRFANTSPGAVRVGYNGLTNQQTFNNADNTYVAGQAEFAIGAETDGLREPHDGLLPEVFVYNRELTDLEVKRVNTYLGIKYGIHVTDDYLSGAGTMIWDKTVNTAYHNNVFGIGRDDCQALLQKQSKSVNTSGFVVVSNGTSVAATNAANTSTLTDASFEIVGDNNLAADYTTAYTPSFATNGLFFYSMPRIWKVQETGVVGQVTIRISGTAQNTYLLVKNTATFGSGATEYLMAKDGKGNLVVMVDLANGDFFTFATPRVAPGAVTTALSRWYKADYNASNTEWNDASPNLKNTTTATGSINFNNTGANFNPYVNFNSGYFQAPAAYQGINTANTKVFTVNIPKTGTNNTSWGQQSTSGFNIAAYNPNADGSIYFDAPWSYRTSTNFATAGGVYGVPTLVRDSKFGGSNYIHLAGKQISTAGTGTFTGNFPGSAQLFHIGAQNGATSNNDLAELVIYENAAAMTAAQVQQIESYLAIKYGITLDQTTATDYVNSASAVIWNATTNSSYKKDITVIGRDDASGLDQAQSMSVNASALVTIGLGTIAETNMANTNNFAADKNFEIIGDNGLAKTFSTTIASPASISINNRMARIWKVQETGTVGSVKVAFPNSLNSGATAYLVRSVDATFDATDEFIPLSNLTVGNGSYAAADIDFNNGDYFTVATYVSAPGCVTSIKHWLKSDGAVYKDGGLTLAAQGDKIQQWNEANNTDFDVVQPTLGNRPTYTPNTLVNFNPSVTFTRANTEWMQVDAPFMARSRGTMYVAGRPTTLGVNTNTSGFDQSGNHPSTAFASDNRFFFYTSGSFNYVPQTATLNKPFIGGSTWDNGTGVAGNNTVNLRFDGNNTTFNTGITNVNTAASLDEYRIGGDTDWGSFDGQLNELLVFDQPLTAVERDRVDSYLAIKYGVTLKHPYFNGAGSVVFDTTGYGENIAGIGRELCQTLHQKQSTSQNTGVQPIIGLTDIAATNAANAAVLSDGTFMLWGSDNGAASFATPIAVPSGLTANNRFSRIWKIQETGTVGTVKVAMPTGLNQGSQVYLVRSTNATFDATDEFIPLSNLTVGTTEYDAADINFNNGDYFTFAAYVIAPGCVAGGLDIWLDPAKNVTKTGTVVTGWADSDGNGNNPELTQATTALQPSYVDGDMSSNFNPYINFISNQRLNTAVTGANYSSNITTFGVVNKYAAKGSYNNFIRFTDANNSDAGTHNWGLGTSDITEDKVSLHYISAPFVGVAPGNVYNRLNGSKLFALNTTTIMSASLNATTGATAVGNNGNEAYATGKGGGTFVPYNFLTVGGGNSFGMNNNKTSEIIHYSRELTIQERQRVQTYLAIKYGITLDNQDNSAAIVEGDYIAGDGVTKIWNYANNSTFHNDVFGIGREDCQGLNQKQAQSINQGVRPIFSLGAIAATNATNTNTFAADKSFEIVGSNGLAAGYDNAFTPTSFTPSFPFKHMDRKWKVQETNTVGPVTVKINSNADYMLVDTDGDGNFATGTITEVLLSNKQAIHDFQNGDVFTFGREIVVQTCNTGLAFVHGDDATYTATSGGTVTAGVSAWRSNGDGTFSSTKITQTGFNRDNTGTEVFGDDATSSTYAADVDNDGDKDLIHATENNSNTIYVYLNNGDASFQTTPIVTTGMQAGTLNVFAGETGAEQGWMGDANGDGNVDYIFSGDDKQVHVWFGNGDGTFALTRISSTLVANGYNTSGVSGAEQFLVADVNNDGVIDLAGSYDPRILKVWLGNGDGTFQANPYYNETIQDAGSSNSSGSANDEYSQFADADGDGDLDYIHAEGFDGTAQIWTYLNQGDGTFAVNAVLTQATTLPGVGIADFANYMVGTQSFFADVNNDGKADFITTVDNNGTAIQNGIWVYLATSGGSFAVTPIATPVPAGFATGSSATETSFIACGFIICNAGVTAPSVAATKTNVCPATTANLSTIIPTNAPNGVVTTWHTATPATLSNRVTDSTAVGAGTYYAAFVDKVNNCISPTSTGTVVTITSPCPATFTFNCATASSTGTFAANGTGGQTGTLDIPLTSATAGSATFTVTGTGFTGTLSTTLTAAQASVSIPITYDGTGAARTQTLTVTSTGGTGTCTPSVTITGAAATYTFDCGSATSTGTFAANATAGQTGTLTIGLTGTTAGSVTYTVTGAGFTGSYTGALTAGQTSVAIPITYDGTGVARSQTLTVTGTGSAGSCTPSVSVICGAGADVPNLASNTLTNACPQTTANLSTIAVGNKPSGSTVTWHTATPATTANKVADATIVAAGTYYAAFYNATQDCYGGTTAGAATTAVTVTAEICPADITVTNVCPSNTVDLTTRIDGAIPSGKVVTWHTALPTTTANKVATPATIGTAGTYYAAFYDPANDCYSPGSPNGIVVTITPCQASRVGTNQPNIAAVLDNVCPATTADLTSVMASNQPSGTTLSWHTGSPATNANVVSGSNAVGAGTYYAAFYDDIANDYSPTAAIVVTINTCAAPCNATTTGAPTLSATTAVNSCPIATANLSTITASNLPFGTVMMWHTATPATYANRVADSSAITATGTYYAAFYDIAADCFSTTTSSVAVTITPCVAAFTFNCGSASVNGTFAANAVTGQTGTVTVPISGVTAGTATFTVTGTGFIGTLSTTLTAGQTSVSVPITYDGSGTAGARPLSITSSEGTGTCAANATVSALIATFTFDCATAPAVTGTFVANATAGQTGSVTIQMTGATAGDATFTIAGSGFTGTLTTTLTANQASVSVPITYDGTGAARTQALTIASSQGTGSCATNATVTPQIATFTFNCGSATASGTFVANGTAGQTGSVTVPMTGATAGTATFNVSGTGFAGTLTTTLTANQTSVSVPITYDGTGTTGARPLSITSSQGTGTCSTNATVTVLIASFAFDCGSATATGLFVANGTGNQMGTLMIPMTGASEGTATFNVSGTGFTGTLSTNLTANQASVSIPITYNGTGAARTESLTVTSAQAQGTVTCLVDATIAAPVATFAFDCNGGILTVGSFVANGTGGQNGSLTIPMTGATAGTATFTVTGAGFTGTLTTTLATGQPTVSVPITYDGTGAARSQALSIASTQGSGTCATTATIAAPVATFTFNCGSATASGTFTANGTAGQTGSVTIPLTSATVGSASFTVTGTNFTGTLSTTLTAGQTLVTIPITYDGTGAVGSRTLTVASSEGTGTCTPSVSVLGVPDLTTTIGQPLTPLTVGQSSDLPITVSNIGNGAAPGIITTTITLPSGVTAPATFMNNGWTCNTSAPSVICTNAGPIAASGSSTFNVPVTPDITTVGTKPIFNATTNPVTGETNTGNNPATPLVPTVNVLPANCDWTPGTIGK